MHARTSLWATPPSRWREKDMVVVILLCAGCASTLVMPGHLIEAVRWLKWIGLVLQMRGSELPWVHTGHNSEEGRRATLACPALYSRFVE